MALTRAAAASAPSRAALHHSEGADVNYRAFIEQLNRVLLATQAARAAPGDAHSLTAPHLSHNQSGSFKRSSDSFVYRR